MFFPEKLTCRWIASAYSDGMTPYDLLDEIIRRADAEDDKNIWIVKPSKELCSKYIDRLPKDKSSLPLWGIPFAIKDNIDLEGVPTTAACPDYAYTPEKNSFVVQKLIDAIVSKRAYTKMHARSQRLNAGLNDSLYGVIEFVVSANFDTSRASRR